MGIDLKQYIECDRIVDDDIDLLVLEQSFY